MHGSTLNPATHHHQQIYWQQSQRELWLWLRDRMSILSALFIEYCHRLQVCYLDTDTVLLGGSLVVQNQSIGVASTAQSFSGVDGTLEIDPVDLTSPLSHISFTHVNIFHHRNCFWRIQRTYRHPQFVLPGNHSVGHRLYLLHARYLGLKCCQWRFWMH